MSLTPRRFSRNCVRESDSARVPGSSGAREPAEHTAEADRGRQPGNSSFKVLAGGPGSLAVALCADIRIELLRNLRSRQNQKDGCIRV
jgi:hypothetical protein